MSMPSRALILSLLLALAFASASSARPPGKGFHERDPGSLLREHADEIGLDDETRDAIRSIVRESRESSEELRARLRALHAEMKQLLSQDTPERDAVMELAEEIGEVETLLHQHRLGTLLDIRAELTPEQRQQLAELRREARRSALEPLTDACEEDRRRLCGDAEGRYERMRCMVEHRDEVSEACRDAFEDLRRERPRRWGGGPRP